MPPSLLISNAAICHCLEGYSRDSGSDRNTVRDSGNVNGIRDLTAIKEAGFAAIYQGREGFSQDPGFDRNTVRDSDFCLKPRMLSSAFQGSIPPR